MIGATASQAFTPNKFASLKVHLDASDRGSITSTGGNVSQKNDKSKNANHATQFIGSSQPLTESDTINGKDVITYDGDDDLLLLGSQPIIGTEARTLIGVVLANNSINSNAVVSLSENLTLGGAYRMTTEIAVRIHDASRIFSADAVEDGINAAIIMATNEANSTIENDADNLQVYKNGFLLTGGTSVAETTPVNTNVGTTAIGNEATNNALRLDGVIGEVIIYNRVITAVERLVIHAYLINKWGIPNVFPFVFSSDFSSDFS